MEHPFGWMSLLPPVVAIALAIVTRRAVLSLLAGLFCGALITNQGDLLRAIHDLFEVHLWPTVVDPGKLRVFSFTLLMGGLVGLVIRSGGMQGFVKLISPLARSRRGGQLTTWLMGMLIFFDDYANTLLLGNTLRPVCDRLRISREKLAYIVDSTAAPVAGLSLLSTWVAIEIDFIRQGLDGIDSAEGLAPVDLFVASIPYRFYVIGALVMVPLIAWTGRDFGPMLAAERRRVSESDEKPADPDAEGASPASGEGRSSAAAMAASHGVDEIPLPDRMSHWGNAIVPIFVTLGVVILLIRQTGLAALGIDATEADPPTMREIVGAADSSVALQYGSLCGLLVAMLMYRVQGLLTFAEMSHTIRRGAGLVMPAIAILWLASALSRMTSDQPVEVYPVVASDSQTPFAYRDHRLYTGDYLSQLIAGSDPSSATGQEWTLRMLPTITFLLAGVVSFCTGTSFGTMGMLIPLVLSLTHSLLSEQGGVTADNPLLLASLGGVLAGAIFGDHCSPISDTTILSSQASGCDHIAHVLTQMPYAILLAVIAVLFGTLPVGWGVSPLILIPIQLGCLVLFIRWFGRRATEA